MLLHFRALKRIKIIKYLGSTLILGVVVNYEANMFSVFSITSLHLYGKEIKKVVSLDK